MKNVTVGECKPGKKKKKKKISSKALENASLEKLQRKPGKKKQSSKALENASLEKKTKFKSPGKCYSWNPEKK